MRTGSTRLAARAAWLVLLALAAVAAAGEAPDLQPTIERLKADLAQRYKVAPADVRMLSIAAVVWRDTSLGCGKPNESHAQIDVEGYEVVLEHAGRQYNYRVRKDGSFLLCE